MVIRKGLTVTLDYGKTTTNDIAFGTSEILVTMMKTIEAEHICPYAGLRSFTEEESLYFKGRDAQIEQIADLLEQNKFLMVTGASGEGKSSLIYAGLIPNMRAGFFKAHYTNWVVADFRPERSPLTNMTDAIAQALGHEKNSVAMELKRGFSSLIDLYTSSEFYIDDQDQRWTSLSDIEKKEKKRKAANLLVIIDQFEEFFTNPENFSNEAPSQDSQIVVNLALETSRIALKRGLPVYVVFTMRSDFIGQCVAFRGLPEYIGFSQFFVPRLKRKDFKQVIEEPAILSGNKISQRLIERLVFDIAEGVDQLPVLQHALSQIWLAADSGAVEMDLIHYAMVGGMPVTDLPEEDQPRFSSWLESLPEFKKKYFKETGLQKIIEFHANTLYEGAWEYYGSRNSKEITISQCKRTIALAFTCLTKIDNSRAVRNRMTIGEITSIVNDPEITPDVVSDILTLFREEGNSFIRPYKTADPSTHRLAAHSVLDISHEALIRNWNKLDQWALKEFEFYTTWLDFKKQLLRWKESGKKAGYLLPIGPLTYFENWFAECKPNTGWINRYLQSDQNPESAAELLSSTKEFLNRSARKVIVTRAFMKYGTQRMVTFASIFILLLLSGFYWNDAENKRNEKVISRVIANSQKLLSSQEIDSEDKARYLVVQERYKEGTLLSFLEHVNDPKTRLVISIDALRLLLTMDNHFNLPIKAKVASFIDKQISQLAPSERDIAFLLRQVNRYMVIVVYDNYYNPDASFDSRVAYLTNLLHDLVTKFFKNSSHFEASISFEINFSVQFWLTLGKPSAEQINNMLLMISPFEKSDSIFKIYYAKGSFESDGNRNLDYNGGYHTLASLYAAVGNDQKIIACFEKHSEMTDYFVGGTSGRLLNHFVNIIGFLYQFDHQDKVKNIISWVGKKYPTSTPRAIYKYILNRSGYLSRMYFMNFTRTSRNSQGYIFPNLYLADRLVVEKIAADHVAVLSELPDKSERNFDLAMHYKRMAMFAHKYDFDRGISSDTAKLNRLLDKAWFHFGLVESSYLEKDPPRLTLPYWSDGFRQPKVSYRHLFIYPDYMDGWFSRSYHSDLHFNYMLKRGLLEKNFKTQSDIYYIHFWLAKAYELDPSPEFGKYHNFFPLSPAVLQNVATFLSAKGDNANFTYLLLSNLSFARTDTVAALTYFKKVNLQTMGPSINRFEYLEKTFVLNQLKDVSRNLIAIGKKKEANQVIGLFEMDREKAFSYIFNAATLYENGANPETFGYLDSALSKMKAEDFTTLRVELDYRFNLIRLLSRIGSEQFEQLARGILRDFNEFNKFGGIISMIEGISAEGNYYPVLTAMPSSLTEKQELICYSTVLWQIARSRRDANSQEWKCMDDYFNWSNEYVFYVAF